MPPRANNDVAVNVLTPAPFNTESIGRRNQLNINMVSLEEIDGVCVQIGFKIASRIIAFRDRNGGMISDLEQLRGILGPKRMLQLKKKFFVGQTDGPKIRLVEYEKININKTTAATLLKNVHGVGEKLSQAIVTFVSAVGGIRSMDQLGDIPYVGEGRLLSLKEECYCATVVVEAVPLPIQVESVGPVTPPRPTQARTDRVAEANATITTPLARRVRTEPVAVVDAAAYVAPVETPVGRAALLPPTPEVPVRCAAAAAAAAAAPRPIAPVAAAPAVLRRHNGRRCKDGSLDMRCRENKGLRKYID